MEVRPIGRRGYLFTFDELQEMGCTTNVYVIVGERYIFICDTYLGPYYMEEVKEYLSRNILNRIYKKGNQKQLVIFNSHSDWDHIWGNYTFKSCIIIAHDRCRKNMDRKWEEEYVKHQKFAKGEVKKILPNITFDREITFSEEGIKFIYSPGHTTGSASCLDLQERILFAGDNVEAPHPYLQSDDKETFIHTLNSYLKMDLAQIIPGHGDPCGKGMVLSNIQYLSKLKKV